MIDAYGEMLDDLSRTTSRIQEMSEKYGDSPSAGTAGDWGPALILTHLTDVEKLYRGRMQLILTQETPYLKSANPAGKIDNSPREFRPELEAFAMERGETISLLMNLALKDWERTGIHDEYGELSVEDITERLIEHDNEHLAQMAAAFQH
jgi:hypothetical protein